MKRVHKNKIVDALSFFYLLLALIIIILLMAEGCASNITYGGKTVSDVERVQTKITFSPLHSPPREVISYPLKDNKGVLHKYRDNIDSFIFPKYNEKLTQYCAFHFEWEDIKSVYKKDKNGEWKWYYIVIKNKKSWK